MKPTVSDKNLRDAVEAELDSDPEVVAKYISVTAIDGRRTDPRPGRRSSP